MASKNTKNFANLIRKLASTYTNTSDVNIPSAGLQKDLEDALESVVGSLGGSGSVTLTTIGNSGASTFISNVLNIPNYTVGGSGVTDGDKGDITISGSGTVWTIDNSAITYSKMQNVTTNKLLGRATAGSGVLEEITLGTNLSFTGTTLNAAGGETTSPEPYTSTAYSSTLAFDVASTRQKNFDVTAFNANLTVSFTNLLNGASCGVRLNKTSASALTVTFPASTNIICNTPDCVVSGDVVTITSASGTKYNIDTLKVGSDIISTISRVDVDENYVVSAGVTDGSKGDITVSGSGSTWSIANSVVTYAKMQNISTTNRLLGRITAGAGVAEELTGTQVTSLLDNFTSTLKGLVPLSGGGTTNFLRADGTWAAPSGGGGSGIPLTGTTAGNQVTGAVKLGNAVYIGAENSSGSGTGTKLKMYDNDTEFTNGPSLSSDASIILNHTSNFNGNRSKVSLTATSVNISQLSSGSTNQIDITSAGIVLGASGQKVSFFGGTPIVRQTGASNTAAVAYTANEQTMLQKCYDVLRAYNLMN